MIFADISLVKRVLMADARKTAAKKNVILAKTVAELVLEGSQPLFFGILEKKRKKRNIAVIC